ncbi:MAG: hypothetical protein CMI08_08920 [Oceanospirillaceae bacterium]|uniref:substrate-binding periplasmic protein n=1 Tax=unclassified Thalassolituus TaxID=2624967 RepID=UPI000C3C20FE|nr:MULTISPECIES: transporter substrate-binding domain-containing protein [unclassified Thalassolituus]MAS25806.1 hypothetical protein [Oceanospirillaceae bacterium]MAX99313.1 hypothetical protein [Oceanospirillaceae bacterium]MBL33883.1 hypothetical protein [Oceanospirillaceae bacterium]MBS51288.1 hypothetical protein [Oceanospirillaceae bacterium]MBS54990.1 hypothetical protein [Oceanospirillaceae bacterium]|tara:strand:- start:10264 stop:11022 length:759 start_codon:yes stop_codon:yes gene_type:complete
MRLLILLSILLLPGLAAATELTLGCGNSLPPYVIQHNNRGIALELMQRAMHLQGYRVEVYYGSNSELAERFNRGELDILCITNKDVTPRAYFSHEPLLVFHNHAVTLKENKIRLASVSELEQYRIGAFSLASKLLPVPFAATVAKSPEYTEFIDQQLQVKQLFNKEKDVIIIDRMIFRYFMSRLRRAAPEDANLRSDVELHALFPSTEYFTAFHSSELRNAFDAGMKSLAESGEKEQIITAYDRLLSEYLFQ